MAFLDNSGDIILDAVLTDTGRYRLAKADGSFRIVKFALGDDEINYALYDKNNASGSAYYDLSILQTPILEAFTNNAASIKSKLLSISRNDLLYMPVLKLNTVATAGSATSNFQQNQGTFLVAVDSDTMTELRNEFIGNDIILNSSSPLQGVLNGAEMQVASNFIRVDQGLDTQEITPSFPIDQSLRETQYIIEIDNRLGKIASAINPVEARLSYLDDDQIASYLFSSGTDQLFVLNNQETTTDRTQVIAGPRGTILQFKILASIELNTSTFLFDRLGSTTTLVNGSNSLTVKYIDSIVRVMGATTGYRIDIPVRFIKY